MERSKLVEGMQYPYANPHMHPARQRQAELARQGNPETVVGRNRKGLDGAVCRNSAKRRKRERKDKGKFAGYL
jgi:hypothetical protein